MTWSPEHHIATAEFKVGDAIAMTRMVERRLSEALIALEKARKQEECPRCGHQTPCLVSLRVNV